MIGAEVKRLSKVQNLKALWPIAQEWLMLAAVIVITQHFFNPVLYIFSLILIARGQHALLVMVHEGAHHRLSTNRNVNEWASNYFAAFPNFFCTAGYRAIHLKHHQFLNTAEDPDWARKVNSQEWHYPKTRKQIFGLGFLTFLTTWFKLVLVFLYLSGLFFKKTYQLPAGRRLLLQKILFYGVAGSVVLHFHLLHAVWLYWLVPYLFVFPLIERVRNVSEHFGLPEQHEYSKSRNVMSSPLESFFFGPHNVRYHLVHHLYPTVPQYNLPELSKILNQDAEYQANAHNNTGYFLGGKKSVFWDLQQSKRKIPTALS